MVEKQRRALSLNRCQFSTFVSIKQIQKLISNDNLISQKRMVGKDNFSKEDSW